MAQRLAEKRAASRRRTWRRIALTCAVATFTASATWVVGFSPLLALAPAAVTVTGEGTMVDAAVIYAQVAARAGIPLARLDTGELRQEILGVNAVKNAQVSRSWPRGIAVVLTAREPAASIPVEGGFLLVDDEGVHLAVVEAPRDGLPILYAPVDDASAQVAALAVLAAVPAELDVYRTEAPTRDDVRTVLRDGRVVRWGSQEQLPLKLAALLTLRDVDPEAWVFDVSSPELPVTR